MPLKLYVKIWCPWCVMAWEWLDAHGFRYELLDVEKNRADYDAMIRLSGPKSGSTAPPPVTSVGVRRWPERRIMAS